MHPLTLWLTSIAELGEREREREAIRRQHETEPVPLTPLERDGRWAAAMHRWAEQAEQAERAEQANRLSQAAAQSTELPPESATPALSTAALPRLGCA
jgi:hypothetical protein